MPCKARTCDVISELTTAEQFCDTGIIVHTIMASAPLHLVRANVGRQGQALRLTKGAASAAAWSLHSAARRWSERPEREGRVNLNYEAREKQAQALGKTMLKSCTSQAGP